MLQLRLALMANYIEKMVIVEANQTFSGMAKPFYYQRQKEMFARWSHKIMYVPVSNFPKTLNDAWEKEHYLRDMLRREVPATDNDLVIIADADEIINMQSIIRHFPIQEPCIIKLATCYHFFNIQSNEIIKVTLIAPYSQVKNIPLGNRNTYKNFVTKYIPHTQHTGGHFTYMFGYAIEKYIKKIQSFSHQEFNTPYWLNPKRILACVKYNMDLFERHQYKYKRINLKKELPQFYAAIKAFPEYEELIKPANPLRLFTRYFNKWYLKNMIYKLRLRASKLKKMLLKP